MSVTETLTFGFDTTEDIAASLGATGPADVSFSLVNLQTGQPLTLTADPMTVGNVVYQQVSGPLDLSTTGRFLLTLNFTAFPTANVWAMQLLIVAGP
jgi:hypothetical protein